MIDPTGFLPMYSCKSDFNCGGGPNGSGDMGYNGLVGTDPNYQLTTTSTTVTTTYSDGTTSSFIIPDTGNSNIGSPPASADGAPNSAQSGGLNATFTRDGSNPQAGGDYTNDTPAYIAALRADPTTGLTYAESILQYLGSAAPNEEALALYANEDGTYSYTFYSGDSPSRTPAYSYTDGDALVLLEHTHPVQICMMCGFFGGAAQGPSIGDSITANQYPNAYMAIWEYNNNGTHDYIYYGPTVGLPWWPPQKH